MPSLSPHALSSEDLPAQFGRYRLHTLLGEGGMGRVFGAELQGPSGFRKEVALKVIRREEAGDDTSYREDFLREARIMGMLRHPNLIDCYDFGFHDDCPFIAMERIEGISLSELLSAEGRLPVSVCLDLAIQLCAGMTEAHGLEVEHLDGGLVHRDLKPGNLIITELGQLKILDFGLAVASKKTDPTHSRTDHGIQGTPGYLSPEQANGAKLDGRSDIYAAGIILFECITGERFFQQREVLPLLYEVGSLSDPSPRTALADSYLPGLGSVLNRSMQRNPDGRFSRSILLQDALQNLSRSIPVGPDLRSFMVGRTQAAGGHQLGDPFQAHDQTTAKFSPDALGRSAPSAEASRASALSAQQTNLPPETESFVGREDTLKLLEAKVTEGSITTLVGTGGAGKTRLARRFAMTHLGEWLAFGGVWFTDLTTARTAKQVVERVAQVLGVVTSDLNEDNQEEAEARVGWALAGRGALLLLLDNFEQVEPSARRVLESWIDLAPKLSLLITSRRPLRSAQEQVVLVDPLSVPEAIQLFELRASTARPDLTLGTSTMPAVTELVTRLDCIPLAIELAAARCTLLSPAQILQRLSKRFSLLSQAGDGQRTLRETIEWSWDLLEDYEQEALWQCTVFRGPFRIEAAEAVLDLRSYRDAPWALDVLQALRERSLLSVSKRLDSPGQIRFVLLESLREFAEEKGQSYPGHDELKSRHAKATLHFAEEQLHQWNSLGLASALLPLGQEEENLLAVIDNQLATAPAQAARAATIASVSLANTRPQSEMVELLEPCLVACRDSGDADSILSRLLLTLCRTTRARRTVEENLRLLQEAMTLAENAGDLRTLITVLVETVYQLVASTRPSHARVVLQQLRETAQVLEDEGIRASLTRSEALVVFFDDPEESERLHQEAIAQWEHLGNRRELATELNFLAILMAQSRRTEEALPLFRRAAENFGALGLVRKRTMLMANLGLAETHLGEFDAARRSLEDSIHNSAKIGNRTIELMSTTSLIELELLDQKFERAAALAMKHKTTDVRMFPIEIRNNVVNAIASGLRSVGQTTDAISVMRKGALSLDQEGGCFVSPSGMLPVVLASQVILTMCIASNQRSYDASTDLKAIREHSEKNHPLLQKENEHSIESSTEAQKNIQALFSIAERTVRFYVDLQAAGSDGAAQLAVVRSARKALDQWSESLLSRGFSGSYYIHPIEIRVQAVILRHELERIEARVLTA